MSNVGSRFAGRHKRASVTRAERQRARALASSAKAADAPAPANPHPFMLAPQVPSFPSDVAIPPHRGAVIGTEPADSLSDYPIARPKAKPGSKTTKASGKSAGTKAVQAKAPAARSGAAKATTAPRPTPRSASPKPSATRTRTAAARPAGPAGDASRATEPVGTVAPVQELAPIGQPAQSDPPPPRESAHAESVPVEPAAPPIVAPAEAAPAPAEPPPAGQRALVKQDHGLIGRLVAWLGRLVPRKRRAALPRARTRLERPAAPPAVPTATAAPAPAPMPRPDPAPTASAPAVPLTPAAEPLVLPTESILSGRMVLKLSEENSRLRRELDALRASVEKGD